MIRDLAGVADSRIERQVQVCIVGAGTAGLYLAKRLRELRLSVLVLEAGDDVSRRPTEIGYTCLQRGLNYRGADQGRAFGLGGTSALWGGQMIPLTVGDVSHRPWAGINSWPIRFEEISAFFPQVLKTLGLPSYEEAEARLKTDRFPELACLANDFDLRLSQWIPFSRRNFSKAFSESVNSDKELEVWLNSSAVRLVRSAADGKARIYTVEASSPNKKKLLVKSETVIIAAGALESTRLLLELDEATNRSITRSGSPLGNYFSDHLSITCGRFHCQHRHAYNLATSAIFEHGIMRTPRLELSTRVQERLGVTSAFAHFTFQTKGDTGFDIIRNLLRKRQGERQSLGLSPRRLSSMANDVLQMATWRYVSKRLWIPRTAELILQIDIEQRPNRDSRLTLSNEKDAFGRKRLDIDWKISAEDIELVRTVATRISQAWSASPLGKIAQIELNLPDELNSFQSLYDVYHPTGTLRMGRSAADSVLDSDLKVWGLENLYVSSTAVFPSAGSANPGLTHLALTERLAAHLALKHS